MAILGFEIEEIARLVTLLDAHELEELIIEEEGRSLRLRSPNHAKLAPPQILSAMPTTAVLAPIPTQRPPSHKPLPPSGTSSLPGAIPEDQRALISPMVGVFYRSEKPSSPPFINIGERIAIGQTIGMIEAMKVFSEVPAEQAGIVVAIPAHDGQLVQAGSPLVILQSE